MLLIGASVLCNNTQHNILLCGYKQGSRGNGTDAYLLEKPLILCFSHRRSSAIIQKAAALVAAGKVRKSHALDNQYREAVSFFLFFFLDHVVKMCCLRRLRWQNNNRAKWKPAQITAQTVQNESPSFCRRNAYHPLACMLKFETNLFALRDCDGTTSSYFNASF